MTDTELTITANSSRSMLRTANSLLLNTGVNAALGVGYWIAAARIYPPEIVGRDGALIAAMAAISALCGLNMNNNIVRFLPARRVHVRRMVLYAYGISAVGVAAGAVAFVLVIPAISHQFSVLSDQPRFAVFYAASVVAWTVFGLQDAALTAVRRATWVPIENAIYGVAKLALLPIFFRAGITDGILLAWIVPMLVLLLPVNGMLFGRWLPRHAREPIPPRTVFGSMPRGRLIKFVAQDTVATAVGMAARTLLPALAVAVVGSKSAAHFFVPFTIISTFDLLSTNVTTSLVAEAARGEVALHGYARTVWRFMKWLLLATVALIVTAEWVLVPFGSEYAHGGATVLRLMAAACAFRAITSIGIAVARLERNGLRSLMIQCGSATLLVLFVAVFAHRLPNSEGIALAWLVASACTGIATLPYVLRAMRSRPQPEPA